MLVAIASLIAWCILYLLMSDRDDSEGGCGCRTLAIIVLVVAVIAIIALVCMVAGGRNS